MKYYKKLPFEDVFLYMFLCKLRFYLVFFFLDNLYNKLKSLVNKIVHE
jgi:hypothetical protein